MELAQVEVLVLEEVVVLDALRLLDEVELALVEGLVMEELVVLVSLCPLDEVVLLEDWVRPFDDISIPSISK